MKKGHRFRTTLDMKIRWRAYCKTCNMRWSAKRARCRKCGSTTARIVIAGAEPLESDIIWKMREHIGLIVYARRESDRIKRERDGHGVWDQRIMRACRQGAVSRFS